MLLAVVLLGLWLLADRWWPLLPLLYGPRWILAPLALTPLLAHRRGTGRATLMALTAGLVVVALLVDFRTGWRRLMQWGTSESIQFRVVSWNAEGGRREANQASMYLAELDPDLIVIAECSPELGRTIAAMLDMELHRNAAVCIATRHRVIEWAPRSPRDFWRAGGSGAIARITLDVDGIEVVVGGVHLETPRDALGEFEVFPIGPFRKAAIANQDLRDVESATARTWIAAPHEEIRPIVVAGDFNLPVESAIYRRWWGDLDNAFSVAGFGLGWTKRTEWLGVRIDHVVAGNGARVRRARLGPAMGSDHRPVIADLLISTSVLGHLP